MTKKPLVSIIIPCFNCVKTIDETVVSILDQNYDCIEILLINDGSTDVTLQHLKENYSANQSIKIIDKKNSGVSSARNKGIEESSGDLLVFLDSDDLFAEGKLGGQVNYLVDNNLDIVFGDILRFEDTPSGRTFFNRTSPPICSKEGYFDSVIKMDLFSYANFSTGIFKRKVFERLRWNENRFTGEDWELWTKISTEQYAIGNYDMVTNLYRKHSNNTTKKYFELMTLESHVDIISNSVADKSTKTRLVKLKIEYYSNILKNRGDRNFSQSFRFMIFCLCYPRSLSLRSLMFIIKALF